MPKKKRKNSKKKQKKKILYMYIPIIQSKEKTSQVLLFFYILNSIKQANLLIKVPDLLFYFTSYIILSRNIVLILHDSSLHFKNKTYDNCKCHHPEALTKYSNLLWHKNNLLKWIHFLKSTANSFNVLHAIT